jgi:hypothetical protein
VHKGYERGRGRGRGGGRLAYWFLVRCSWSFFVLGLWASISTPLPTCPLVTVSPRSASFAGIAAPWGAASSVRSANRAPWRGFRTLSEALKRPSVRLGAPTASARHWLSQMSDIRSDNLLSVEEIRSRKQHKPGSSASNARRVGGLLAG